MALIVPGNTGSLNCTFWLVNVPPATMTGGSLTLVMLMVKLWLVDSPPESVASTVMEWLCAAS
jgi:hypothetical protein